MTGQRASRLAAVCVGAIVFLAAGTTASELKAKPGQVHIGLVATLFRDLPTSAMRVLMQPFNRLMRSYTGLEGKLLQANDALLLGQMLNEGKIHLGVFHGVEFAWAQQKYPELRPLMIAINKHRKLHAHLVVRDDSNAADFAGLKGKAMSLPRRSREHCRLFLERHCRECGDDPKAFFTQIVEHTNVEEGLDDVVRGKVQGAVVDGLSLECYKLVKSGCYARLKIVKQSEAFPAAVIAYRHGGNLDAATLQRFRKGMINANKDPEGRDLMGIWKLTAFEPIPADYQHTLRSILKSYPCPEGIGAKTSTKAGGTSD